MTDFLSQNINIIKTSEDYCLVLWCVLKIIYKSVFFPVFVLFVLTVLLPQCYKDK